VPRTNVASLDAASASSKLAKQQPSDIVYTSKLAKHPSRKMAADVANLHTSILCRCCTKGMGLYSKQKEILAQLVSDAARIS
jgi:hypothetical protein